MNPRKALLNCIATYLKQSKLNDSSLSNGYTLIELLVVIILIGILASIALPSFLNQAAKARAAEARTNVGAMNRAQQAFYLENQIFVVSATGIPAELGLGIQNTTNYSYSSVTAEPLLNVINNATVVKPTLKAYSGGVFQDVASGSTQSILCETNTLGIPPVTPVSGDPVTGCPSGSKALN